MKERKTAKNTITLLLILAFTMLAAGCGDKENNVSADKDVSGEATEVIVEETETEEDTQAAETDEIAETTEAATEEVTEEDDVLAIGYSRGHNPLKDQPSSFEYTYIGELYEGDTVNIIGEFYNEREQIDFWQVRLASGEEGYIQKECIQLAE